MRRPRSVAHTRDPSHFGDAPGHAQIRLHDVGLTLVEHLGKFETGCQSHVACPDWGAVADQGGVTVDVVDRQRRFQPVNCQFTEHRHQRQNLIYVGPGGRRVDDESDVRSQMAAAEFQQRTGFRSGLPPTTDLPRP